MLHRAFNVTCRTWAVWFATTAVIVIAGLLGVTVDPRTAAAQTCRQAVRNAGFEDGAAGWETRSAAGMDVIVPEAAFNGAYGARLGGADSADDGLWQSLTLPESLSNLSLAFFFRIESAVTNELPADHLTVQLLDEQGNVLLELVRLDNQDPGGQWLRRLRFFKPEELEILAGRRVQLQFRVETDASAPTTFLIDDVSLEVCTSGPPAVSDLRMSQVTGGSARDYFGQGLRQVSISFTYENIREGDALRLLLRDVNGTQFLDHTYRNLLGSGTQHVIFTARDAVDGLVRAVLDAGDGITGHSERVLQGDSRFDVAPYLERVVFGVAVMDNATRALRQFEVGAAADAYLVEAQEHIDAAEAAGQAALDPESDLDELKAHVVTLRDEAQRAMVKVADVRSVLRGAALVFPDTFDCRFNLTSIYLNEMPADSVEWTVGDPGPPARIHPPHETRRSGVLDVEPLTVYAQQVTSPDAPHEARIAGRVVDADCRPVADGTPVTFALDTPSLGELIPGTATTSGGRFATTLRTTGNLGDGVVTVRAWAGESEATEVVFLVGPPATVSVDTEAATVNVGHSTAVLVQVVDALGQAVADGTEVSFSVEPAAGGSITPAQTTTSNGYASATFVAGDVAGPATIRVSVGDVADAAVVEVAGPAATATPSPTATPAPTATPTASPTPTPTCDPSDPEQICNGAVAVRVFGDARCDGYFNQGMDQALSGVSVSLIYPDGTSTTHRTDPHGNTYFGQVRLRGDERLGLLAEYPEELIVSGLTPCDNSGTLKFLEREDFGSFTTASVAFRAHRQVVTRRGVLHEAEASLCFTATYYLEPTDGGPVAYLMTDQNLSEYLGTEIEVTGPTWEIEFCRYLLPFSIEPVS